MHIIFFPYLDLKDTPQIAFSDEFKIWNFDKCCNHHIKIKGAIEKIRKISNSITVGGKPIENFGVFHFDTSDYQAIETNKIFELATEMKLLMFLGFIAKNNAKIIDVQSSSNIATADCFVPIVQNFQIDVSEIAFMSGYIVPKIEGGFKIGEKQFDAQRYLIQPNNLTFDEDLIKSLLKIKKTNAALYQKSLNAIDFIFQSYYNSIDVSKNARILLQTAAFETLLKSEVKKDDFRKIYKKWLGYYFTQDTQTTTFESKRGVRLENETGTWSQYWADSFFTLRNSIIHGDELLDSDFYFFNQRHIDLGLVFFVLTLKKLIDDEVENRNVSDYIYWENNKEKFMYKESCLREILEG